MRIFKLLFLLLVIVGSSLYATVIDISKDDKISLLENSSIYLDKEGLSLREIEQRNLFEPYVEPQINTGVSNATIWLKIELRNSMNFMQKKAIILRSHRLENITLYHQNGKRIGYRGVSYRKGLQSTLYPFFRIKLPSNRIKIFYLKIKSIYSPVLFSVTIEEEKSYRKEDKRDQIVKMFFLGMIFSLMVYSLVLSFYTRDKSYLFYSFYLFTVVYQQVSYMGFSQVYLPLEWVELEKKLVMPKIGLMLISTALFAMHFLKTWSIKSLHRGYQFIILLGIMEILFLTIAEQFSPSAIESMGKLFVILNIFASIFNLFASIVYYHKGNREARLYILGFGILFVTYLLWTLGTLGLSMFIYNYPNTIIIGTTLEALVLSLAFADRYSILQKEKVAVDKRILDELKNREKIVKDEVVLKTAQLKQALDTKEFLLQEVHHRVKNNLQIILSMIRLQQNKLSDKAVVENLVNLENRINAIAKTYNMLLIGENLEEIDMQEYVELLLMDIERTIGSIHHDINIVTDIQTTIPLRESVYIGLIINELVTNAYKYAFDESGTITISLSQNGREIQLIIEDDGKGFVYDEQSKSLGLKLIRTLVINQLKGSIEASTYKGTKYIIRFKI